MAASQQPLWYEFLRNVMVAQQVAETFAPSADEEPEMRKSMNRNFQLCHKSLKAFLLSCVKSKSIFANALLHYDIRQQSNIDSNMIQQGVVTRGCPRTPDGSPNESFEHISTSEQIRRLFRNGTPSPDFNRKTFEARNRSSMSQPPSPYRSKNQRGYDNSRSYSRSSPRSNYESKAQTIRNNHFRGPTSSYSARSRSPSTRPRSSSVRSRSRSMRPRSPSHSDKDDSSWDRRTRRRHRHSVRSGKHRHRSSERSSSTFRNRSRRHKKNNHSRRSQNSSQRDTTRRRSRSTSRRTIKSPPQVSISPKPLAPSSTTKEQSQFNRENQLSAVGPLYQNISRSATPLQNTNGQGTSTFGINDYAETIRFHQQYSAMAYYQSQHRRFMPRHISSYHEPLRVPHPYYFSRQH